jgi:hypothetical protein
MRFIAVLLTTCVVAYRVPVDLYVMSTCPDGALCSKLFDTIFDDLHSIMDMNVDYVASSLQPTKCKRGPEDCEGNRQQLCYRQYHQDPHQWFKVLSCMSWKQDDIPSVQMWRDCANKFGAPLSTSDLSCVNGEDGRRLLEQSARRTLDRGVKKSCTIFLNNKKRCVHDGTWKECTGDTTSLAFVKDICDVYEKETGQRAPVCTASLNKQKWSELDETLREMEGFIQEEEKKKKRV